MGLFAGAPDRGCVVLVGAVLLVVIGGIYVVDRNRAHSHINHQELRYSIDQDGGCLDNSTLESVPMSNCNVVSTIDWRARKGRYEYAAPAIVVLTLASAFALSRRTVAA